MLDRMRRHQSWLKWILGVVVVAFIFIYVPSFLGTPGGNSSANAAIATVDGRKILVGTYQRAYDQQVQAIRNAYGDQFNDQMLQQMGIARRLLQQLMDDEAVQVEAERLGLRVSDEELSQRIQSIPGFKDPTTGKFIGDAAYQRLLKVQRPPIIATEFEREIRRQMLGEKMQALVTGWVQVEDNEVDQEYRKRNEKVKLELAVFTATQFRNTIQPTEAELTAQFSANIDKYRLPEKRRVKYLAVDSNSLKAKMTATPQEIQALYEQNKASYSTPEQVRASHILLKTEGKDAAAVKKQAEAILAKAKAPGADFAALAKQYSDDGSKDNGGDLDFFAKGRMVKPFEDAAWPLQVGQISGLVESEYGFHIIKLTDRKAAMTRTFDQVRPQIEDQIKTEKARAAAGTKATELASQIKTAADLDKVARTEGLAISDSGLFAREEPMAGLGFAPGVAAKAFDMEVGKVSDKLETQQGFAWITLVEIKPSAAPTLDQVKDRVKDDVVRVKAVDVAKARAAAMAKAVAAGASFAAAAKAAGVEVKTTEMMARGTALPEIGINQQVEDIVFKLKTGETSGPISTDNAVVVARVKEKQDVKPEEMTTGKAALRDELRQQHMGQFFAAYMTKARAKMTLTVNDAAMGVLLGGK
jgi:peptidyl-prolyl cis-trans isomerase D